MKNYTDALLESIAVTLKEDINATPQTMKLGSKEELLDRFGGIQAEGNIKSLVPVRDRFGDDEMYEALSSMVMRICKNLHHKDAIYDEGWYYCKDRTIVWIFLYATEAFKTNTYIFIASPADKRNSFDIWRTFNTNEPNRDNPIPGTYYDVLTSAHPWCTNTADTGKAIDMKAEDVGKNGSAPEDGNTSMEQTASTAEPEHVRDIVRQAIKNEIAKSVRHAVGTSIADGIGDTLSGGGFGGVGMMSDSNTRVTPRPVGGANVSTDAFIERLVDAVMAALKANGIIK